MKHSDMVRQLAKSGQDIIDELTPLSAHLLHMSVGISGEAGELLEATEGITHFELLDIDNITEELGDVEFYLEGFRQGMGYSRENTLPEKLKNENFPNYDIDKDFGLFVMNIIALSMHSSILLDITKKYSIYAKPNIDGKKCISALGEIEYTLECIRQYLGIIYEQTIEHNINKLGVRYKGHEYSNQQAHDRADKK